MRVIAGRLRGRRLAGPPAGVALRPTADRTRQAIFDMLAHAPWAPGFAGVRVIDLFAGTGAYGIEALSRGAAMALFVEREAKAAETIRVNLAALALGPDVARVLVADVARLGPPTGPPADIAFLDPPWGADLATAGLAPLAAGWLAPGGLALVETAAREDWEAPPGWTMSADRRWGRARVTVLRLEGGVDR